MPDNGARAFRELMSAHTEAKKAELYDQYKYAFEPMLKTADDIRYILEALSPDQITETCETLKDKILLIINHSTKLRPVFWGLNPEQITAFLNVMKDHAKTIFRSFSALSHDVFRYIDHTKIIAIYKALLNDDIKSKKMFLDLVHGKSSLYAISGATFANGTEWIKHPLFNFDPIDILKKSKAQVMTEGLFPYIRSVAAYSILKDYQESSFKDEHCHYSKEIWDQLKSIAKEYFPAEPIDNIHRRSKHESTRNVYAKIKTPSLYPGDKDLSFLKPQPARTTAVIQPKHKWCC